MHETSNQERDSISQNAEIAGELLVAIHCGTAPGIRAKLEEAIRKLDEGLPPGIQRTALQQRCTW